MEKKGLQSACECCKSGHMYTAHADVFGKRPCDYTPEEKERMRQSMLSGVFVGAASR